MEIKRISESVASIKLGNGFKVSCGYDRDWLDFDSLLFHDLENAIKFLSDFKLISSQVTGKPVFMPVAFSLLLIESIIPFV